MGYLMRHRSLLLILIVLLAFALRLWDIDGRSLWFDEGMEYWVATSSLRDLPQNVRQGIQDPPLYSLVLHTWMGLGEHAFYLRFPSVILSMLSVVGVIKLGDRLGGSTVGLIAGAIMALLPTQIRYAQEIGQYALMGGLLVWNLIALCHVRDRAGWTAYLLWLLSALAVTYSYYGAVFTAVAAFGVEVIDGALHRRRQRLARGLSALALYGLGIIPLLTFFLPTQLNQGLTAAAFHPSFSSLLLELQRLATSTQGLITFILSGWPWTPVSRWLPSTVVAILLGLSCLKARRSSDLRRWWLWLMSSWGAYYVVGKLNLFPYGFRYGLILVPLLVPAIASGSYRAAAERHWQAIGLTCLILLLLIGIISLPNLAFRNALYANQGWDWPETEGVREIVRYWLDHGGATTPTYVYYGAAPAFAYYLRQYGPPQDLSAVWYKACWRGHSPGTCARDNVYYGRWLRALTPEKKAQSILETLSCKPEALWMVFAHVYPGEDEAVLGELSTHYRVAQSYAQADAQLHLLKRGE
jgi:4-amino-4-deoxy-L-arabinose transferase-like glycosyltransferase